MKLASLKHGRDGKLIVVSKDLTKATSAERIAPTMQAALDNWVGAKPQLEKLSADLNEGKEQSFAFNPAKCSSPLPRAYQWADGSAYVNHVELVRKSRGADMPASFWTDPLMYQGGSDAFLGPRDDILMETEEWGIDFEAEIAVITDDVPMGVPAADAGQHIQLLMLVNDVSLRALVPPELAKGFGFFQSKPSSAFSPVAVTPDELGDAWQNYKVHLPVLTTLNGRKYGSPDAGVDMVFNFATLTEHAAKTRPLCAGTIIGSGTISNIDKTKGFSCIVEQRMLEKLETGESKTPFMAFGDRVKIEMLDAQGKSIFGAIEQAVARYHYRSLPDRRNRPQQPQAEQAPQETEESQIPFCKACHTNLSGAENRGHKNGYDLLACPNCGTVTVNPFPTAKQLNAFYQGYEGTTDYRSKGGSKIRRAKNRIKKLKGLTHGRRFLDIGCNYGFTVKAAQDLGLKAYGIDLDNTAVTASREAYGLRNFETISAQTYAKRGEHADIIYTSEVIEHVPDPDVFVGAIASLLNEDGVLYLTTPDASHWRVPGDLTKWEAVIPPEHLTYFTRKGMRNLLERHGLRVEKFFFSLKPGMRLIARKS